MQKKTPKLQVNLKFKKSQPHKSGEKQTAAPEPKARHMNKSSSGEQHSSNNRVKKCLTHMASSGSQDLYIICGDAGQDQELWYRCTSCGLWVHAACSGAVSADGYECDYSTEN